MDKLMDNHWFLKGISLLLALMLYMSTGLEKNAAGDFKDSLFPVGDTTETISDFSLAAYYDKEKYIVSGIPSTVDITLQGTNTDLAQVKAKKQFEVFVNLRGYSTGTHTVPVQYSGIPNDLKVKIKPEKIQVTIQKKAAKSFPVEVKYLNENQAGAGVTFEKPVVKPNTVEVIGTEEELAQIALVRAYVDLKGVNKSVTREAEVVLYDKNGKRLELKTNPAKINITVPVSAASAEKTVPIKVVQKGSLQEGLTVTNIKVEPAEVKITGPQEVLNAIEFLEGVEVDLSKITESTTFDASVLLPKDVRNVTPSKVKVTVNVQKQAEKQTSKTFDDIALQVNGLSEKLNIKLLSPETGKISVDIIGEASIIEKVTAEQIKVSISLQNLSAGTHNVKIEASGPEGVTIKLKQENAKVELVEKENPDQETQGQTNPEEGTEQQPDKENQEQ
ncbi:YbbR-like domain-containing protein [Bacillus manliponensis]|uniref:CdaR family protein n=1 Tax=Bacillus manliponensis TaxID=574376 RepID=UPI0035135AE8